MFQSLLAKSAEKTCFWPLTNTDRLCYGIYMYIHKAKERKKYNNNKTHTQAHKERKKMTLIWTKIYNHTTKWNSSICRVFLRKYDNKTKLQRPGHDFTTRFKTQIHNFNSVYNYKFRSWVSFYRCIVCTVNNCDIFNLNKIRA